LAGRKPDISIEAAEDFLRREFGAVTDITRLAEGEESQAFGASWNGRGFVLRINIARQGFDMDRMAFERFNSSQVPVPEVLLIAPLGKLWACVSSRVDGMTLQELPAGEAFGYGQAVCNLLTGLADTDVNWVDGFGSFSANGEARHKTWAEFILVSEQRDWTCFSPEQRSRLPTLYEWIAREGHSAPERRGLIHGDFGSNNVLVAKGAVAGLIDWSEAMVGDPLYDVANLFFWRTWLGCMEQQCRYIVAHEPQMIKEPKRLVAYAIHIGLDVAHEAATSGNAALAEWALARCETLLVDGLQV